MALINGMYIFVQDEKVNHEIESTNHPVEKGIDITDHIKLQPVTLSISGKIVNYNGVKANEILSKILRLQKDGSLISYSGRNVISGLQIQNFQSSHPNTNMGGLDFDMQLKQIRVAQSSYTTANQTLKPKTNSGTQQIQQNKTDNAVYHIVKKGDTVYGLVTNTYKSLGSTIQQVVAWNPKAFSKPTDPKTLQVGAKILIGYKKYGGGIYERQT